MHTPKGKWWKLNLWWDKKKQGSLGVKRKYVTQAAFISGVDGSSPCRQGPIEYICKRIRASKSPTLHKPPSREMGKKVPMHTQIDIYVFPQKLWSSQHHRKQIILSPLRLLVLFDCLMLDKGKTRNKKQNIFIGVLMMPPGRGFFLVYYKYIVYTRKMM